MPDYSHAQSILSSQNVLSHASEIHGALAGLISAGMAFEDSQYISIIADMFNNGEPLPKEAAQLVKNLFSDLWQQLADDSFAFQLLIPDDDESLAERTQGIASWVQGFNLGFALQLKSDDKTKQTKLSEDVEDVLKDFAEIANLAVDVDDDEESEQAFFEVNEYVRLSALMCFAELGQAPATREQNQSLH